MLTLLYSPTLPPQMIAKHRVFKFQKMSLSEGQMTVEGNGRD